MILVQDYVLDTTCHQKLSVSYVHTTITSAERVPTSRSLPAKQVIADESYCWLCQVLKVAIDTLLQNTRYRTYTSKSYRSGRRATVSFSERKCYTRYLTLQMADVVSSLGLQPTSGKFSMASWSLGSRSALYQALSS